jgi:hypothetical protein
MSDLTLNTALPDQAGVAFDLADFVTAQALQAMSGQRQDSAGTAFAIRSLTDIYGRTFDVKYPDLKARSIIPIFTGVDPGADGFSWDSYDRVGSAGLIDNYGADLPTADVFMTSNMSRCYSIGVSYNYSIQDLRAARKAGVPLEARKAFSARRAMEQAIDQIAFFGVTARPGTGTAQALKNVPATQSTTDNLQAFGITNFPGLPKLAITNDWTLASTAVQTIVDDWCKAVNKMITDTDGIHTPNTVVMALSIWNVLNKKPRSVAFTEDTVLQYLLKLTPMIKNVFWTIPMEVGAVKQDTTTVGPGVMFLERNEENLQLVLPGGFEQLPPQMINLTFKVPCHQRVAGVRVSYPKAHLMLNGCAG